MKTTSVEYKQGMQAPFRRKSHIEITWLDGATPATWHDVDIVTATVTREVDPLARKIPTETITFGIIDYAGDYDASNPSGKLATMDEGKEIAVRFGLEHADGTTEWLAYDQYFLDGKPSYAKNIATFRASSLLMRLNKTTFYKGYSGMTANLNNLASAVLADAGLSSSQYDLDNTLVGKVTSATFPLASHAAILQMIAHEAGCAIYTSGTKIYIKPIDISNLTYHPFPIGLRDMALGTHQTDRTEPLGKVLIKSHQFVDDASTSELARYTATVSGSASIHVEYPMASGVLVSITGGTITSQACYACAADVTVSASGTVTLVFTGKKVSTAETTYEYVANADPTYAVDIENNPILDGSGNTLATQAIDYFSNRVSDSFTYRGDPAVEPLDGIYLQVENGTVYPAIVVKQTLKYNGALSGTITARRTMNTQARGNLFDVNNSMVEDDDASRVLVISQGIYKSAYTTAQMEAFCTAVLGE